MFSPIVSLPTHASRGHANFRNDVTPSAKTVTIDQFIAVWTSCLIYVEHAQMASSGKPTGLDILHYIERNNIYTNPLLISFKYVADIDSFACVIQYHCLEIL